MKPHRAGFIMRQLLVSALLIACPGAPCRALTTDSVRACVAANLDKITTFEADVRAFATECGPGDLMRIGHYSYAKPDSALLQLRDAAAADTAKSGLLDTAVHTYSKTKPCIFPSSQTVLSNPILSSSSLWTQGSATLTRDSLDECDIQYVDSAGIWRATIDTKRWVIARLSRLVDSLVYSDFHYLWQAIDGCYCLRAVALGPDTSVGFGHYGYQFFNARINGAAASAAGCRRATANANIRPSMSKGAAIALLPLVDAKNPGVCHLFDVKGRRLAGHPRPADPSVVVPTARGHGREPESASAR